MNGHCFISYSTADALEFATKLSDELEGGHPFIKVWFDKRDLRSEETWDSQLAEAIKTCKCMFFIMSHDSTTNNSVCVEEWDWAMRYKKPVVPLRLHSDIEVPFRLGRRQWIDFSGEFKVGIAKLRKYISWIESPEGIIQTLKYRLADAERDLRRANNLEDQQRVQAEINDLNAEIKANELINKDPEKAKKQTRKNINTGLERDRQPVNFTSSKASTKFINPRPGSIPDYFEGRLVETEEITDFLRNDFQRLLIINGRAGSGKTVLACRILQYLENGNLPNELGEFRIGGIVYLSEISNYKVNVANIFTGLLELIEPQKAQKVVELYKEAKIPIDEKMCALLAALPTDPVILLLDNFEDLLNPNDESIIDQELHTSLMTVLQSEIHHLKVIITTRELPRQLNMIEPARQYIQHLEEGLPSPFAENVLRKMDKDGRAGFRDAPNELLGRVREATLGYPRALEALYAILRVDRYTSVEELLIEGIPETVVEKFVGEAFSRLDVTSQKIIQAIAIFNRPVSSVAIDFVLQFHVPGINSAPILERLVSMHFVRRESKRYFLHPADRHYALGRMLKGGLDKKIGQGARARTWDQHSLTLRAADYFVEVRKPQAEWKKIDDLAAQLAEFDLRCAASDYDTAAKVLKEIDVNYLWLWGHYRLMIELHLRVKDNIKDKNLHMGNLNGLGIALNSIGMVKEAIAFHQQGLDAARETRIRGWEGVFLGNMGNAYVNLGDFHKAITLTEQALHIAREPNNKGNESAWINNLGLAYTNLGNAHKAIEFYKQGLVIDRETGDKKGEAICVENIGYTFLSLEDYQQAEENIKLAIKIADEISFQPMQLFGRWRLTQVYLLQDNLISAHATIEAALKYDVPENNHNASALHGIIALRQGDEVAARGAFLRAIGQADEILSKTAEYYSALDAKGLALCGLVLAGRGDPSMPTETNDGKIVPPDKSTVSAGRVAPTVDDAIETFRKARKIAPHAGVVKSVLRLFDELAKCDQDGVLKDVRNAAEGKE